MPVDILVIGGGASGLMAAGRAAECGARVTVLEKMPRLGLKLGLTGKGRCNVTNASSLTDYTAGFHPDGRFLTNALNRFFWTDMIAFLEKWKVTTVVERGNRVFPASNRALDVVSALLRYTKANGVKILKGIEVKRILTERNRVKGADTNQGIFPADRVILATGGASYPQTGSTGDGFRIAAELGHGVTKIRPYLIPLVVKEEYVKDLQGLSLKNVKVTVYVDGKRVGDEFGEMIFTHFGVSGPIILTLSGTVVDRLGAGKVEISICLKPALDAGMLDARLKREFTDQGKKGFKNILPALVPKRLAEIIPVLSGIPSDKKGGQITAEERRRLAAFLHDWRLNVTGARPLSEAIITAGGVLTKEINPITMESKRIKGLYFCGEVVDLQARTGGFNLQMAFTTGWIAGESASA
ncbi:MAG: NAD(P)/FAD-dependent oxidoreductase [Pseudomonadota bacterium]